MLLISSAARPASVHASPFGRSWKSVSWHSFWGGWGSHVIKGIAADAFLDYVVRCFMVCPVSKLNNNCLQKFVTASRSVKSYISREVKLSRVLH